MIKGIWNPFRGWSSSELYFNASTPEFWMNGSTMILTQNFSFLGYLR